MEYMYSNFACLSLTLPYSMNHWANVIVAVVLFIFNIIDLPGYPGAHDKFVIIVGLVFKALTIWYAWTWSKERGNLLKKVGGSRVISPPVSGSNQALSIFMDFGVSLRHYFPFLKNLRFYFEEQSTKVAIHSLLFFPAMM